MTSQLCEPTGTILIQTITEAEDKALLTNNPFGGRECSKVLQVINSG